METKYSFSFLFPTYQTRSQNIWKIKLVQNYIQESLISKFSWQKMLRKGTKVMWKIIFFSLDDMENMMEKKYKGKY